MTEEIETEEQKNMRRVKIFNDHTKAVAQSAFSWGRGEVVTFGSHTCKGKADIKIPIERDYSSAMVYPEKK